MFPPIRITTLGLVTGVLLLGSTASSFATDPSPIPSPLPSPVATPAPSMAPVVAPDPCATLAPEIATLESEVGTASPIPSASPIPTLGVASPAPTDAAALLRAPDDPKIGMGIGPSRIILGADERSGRFSIYNAGNMEETVTVTPRDMIEAPDGTWQVSDVALPGGVAEWIVLAEAAGAPSSTQSFDLQPQESREVAFCLVVPAGASPGDHFARIVVVAGLSTRSKDLLQPSPAAGSPPPDEHRIAVWSAAGAGVTVVARVDGAIAPRVVVPPFEAFLPNLVLSSDGQVAFTPTIQNEGNVAAVWMPVAGKTSSLADMIPTLQLRATGGVFAQNANLFDGAVDENGDVSLSPLVVLPGATHTQRLTLTDAPLFGTYDYIYTLPGSAADGRETITRTGHFTIVNLQKVLTWIVLPLLVLLALVTLVMIHRHRRTTRRRVAEALRQRELQQARQEAYELARREQQHLGRGPW